MPQYRIAEAEQARALDRTAEQHAQKGERAGIIGDRYVRITVVLAGVLFLVGIGSTFSLAGVRFALLALGGLLLLAAVILISRQPGLPRENGSPSASRDRLCRLGGGRRMRLAVAVLITLVVTAVAVAAMLLVRRNAPDGSYFHDGDRAAGVFGVLATGFAVLLGFVVFLAFASYDAARAGCGAGSADRGAAGRDGPVLPAAGGRAAHR